MIPLPSQYKIHYSLTTVLINISLIIQAVLFNWELGTVIWMFCVESVIIAILGAYYTSRNGQPEASSKYLTLLALFGIILMFLLGQTFPMDFATYYINGEKVSADTFTVLKEVDWLFVFANGILILIHNIIKMKSQQNNEYIRNAYAIIPSKYVPLIFTISIAYFIPWPSAVFLAIKTIFDFEVRQKSK